MSRFDLIIVLASQPDEKTWHFPKQIYQCLDRAAELIKEGQAAYIATSGDHSISLDNRGIKQPFRECDKLAEYLVGKEVPKTQILREGKSRDSISNLYYLKRDILIPMQMRKLLFVVADFRIPRLKYLCEKILGSEYNVSFEPIAAPEGATYNEQHTIKVQSEFLAPMKPGDHSWLADKFYTASMYEYWREHDRNKYKQ